MALALFATAFVPVCVCAVSVVAQDFCSVTSKPCAMWAGHHGAPAFEIGARFQVVLHGACCVPACKVCCFGLQTIPTWSYETIAHRNWITALVIVDGNRALDALAEKVFGVMLEDVVIRAGHSLTLSLLLTASEITCVSAVDVVTKYLICTMFQQISSRATKN
jgi:hypothetical protein